MNQAIVDATTLLRGSAEELPLLRRSRLSFFDSLFNHFTSSFLYRPRVNLSAYFTIVECSIQPPSSEPVHDDGGGQTKSQQECMSLLMSDAQ